MEPGGRHDAGRLRRFGATEPSRCRDVGRSGDHSSLRSSSRLISASLSKRDNVPIDIGRFATGTLSVRRVADVDVVAAAAAVVLPALALQHADELLGGEPRENLLDDNRVLYETLPNSSRRLVNQAIFLTLTVRDPDIIQTQRTPLYDDIARLNRTLQATKRRPRTPQNGPGCPKTRPNGQKQTPTPFGGPGFVQRANGGERGTKIEPKHCVETH
jgi:hypothetical protein